MRWCVTASSEKAAQRLSAWIGSMGVEALPIFAGWEECARPPADVDALLLGGGGDLCDAPGRYETPPTGLRHCCPARDAVELMWVRAFFDARRPVFGVCRGLQVIAVTLGGQLIPDLRRGRPHVQEFHEANGDDARHGLMTVSSGRLASILGGPVVVNSAHHQAVGRVGAFVAVLCSLAGVVEAIETPTGSSVRASAVQWHPERLPSDHPAAANLLRLWIEESRR